MPLPQVVDPAVVTFYEELLKEGEATPEETELLEKMLSRDKVWKKFKSGLHARSLTDKDRAEIKKEKETLEGEYSKKLGELEYSPSNVSFSFLISALSLSVRLLA